MQYASKVFLRRCQVYDRVGAKSVTVQVALEEFGADHSGAEIDLVFGSSSEYDGLRLVIVESENRACWCVTALLYFTPSLVLHDTQNTSYIYLCCVALVVARSWTCAVIVIEYSVTVRLKLYIFPIFSEFATWREFQSYLFGIVCLCYVLVCCLFAIPIDHHNSLFGRFTVENWHYPRSSKALRISWEANLPKK